MIEALSGIDSGVDDPFRVSLDHMPRINQLLAHQKEQVDQVAKLHSSYWKFD